jgi:methyl-accepting chemotaxis protein
MQGAATQKIARHVQEAAQGTGQVSSNILGVNQAAARSASRQRSDEQSAPG